MKIPIEIEISDGKYRLLEKIAKAMNFKEGPEGFIKQEIKEFLDKFECDLEVWCARFDMLFMQEAEG